MIIESKSIAYYLRLSQEDYDLVKGEHLKEESNSISNQRKFLDYYIKRRHEFQSCTIHEYCDDGYTGTNFERPGFKKLLQDAKCGKIDTIIIKDYSRLGRNFIGVGRYLEEVFPQMQIRLLSINDGYDSNHVIDATDSISIPIKNLINDFYIKDLSKKVKSGIRSRQKRGECISANAIFGYKKSDMDIHKLVADEETAYIVRMIFDFAYEGKNSIQIANLLNQQNIMTPAWYKNKSDRRDYKVDDKSIWTSTKVMKIIRDRRYVGDMVGNVRVTTKIAKNDNIRVDRENWIIVEDTHESIVSKVIFFKINEEIMPIKERNETPLGDNRRQGFCYCPHCGRILQKSNTTVNPYLYCVRGRYDDKCKDIKVMVKPLYDILSDLAVTYIKTLINLDEYVRSCKARAMQSHKSEMTSTDIEKEILKLKQSTVDLHEKYRTEKISREEYIVLKKKTYMKIDELDEKKLKIINGIGEKQEQEEWEQKLRQTITMYKSRTVFTEGELAKIIKRVDLYFENGMQIRIRWNYMDFITKMLPYVLAEKKIS